MENKLKAEIRIPTDTYAYVNVLFEGTPKEIREKHDELKNIFKGTDGVSMLDFQVYLCAIIDSDLTEWGTIDNYNMLNDTQKKIAQSLKRLKKRLSIEE